MSTKITEASRFSRRSFLKRGAAFAAAPLIVPGRVLGRDGGVAPSNRIIMGAIGIGRRGISDLKWILPEPDVQFAAVCDVWREHRDRAKKTVDEAYGNADCAAYRDFRDLLAERSDIEAVLIVTGDRWHALASIMAMRAGKDVYCEKPGCLAIADGYEVAQAAKRFGRVFQTGAQRLSEPNFIVCNELLRLGRLGEVKKVRAHIVPYFKVTMARDWLPAEPEPPRDEVDWDMWLGPVAWRPFNKKYLQGAWQDRYDFYSSSIGGWGSHTFTQCQMALGLGDTSPVSYAYVPNDYGHGMVMRFANGVEMVLQQDGWNGTCGVRYEGTKGWVACADGYSRPEVSHAALLADYNKILQDYAARTGRPFSHVRDFLNCVRSRRQPIANADVMFHSMSTVHAGNIAMWLKRSLAYDPGKMAFINDPVANRMRSRTMRAPWQI